MSKIDWITAKLIGAAALVAAIALVFSALNTRTTTEEATAGARRWTDSLGIRVTGIVCNGSTCTIAPEQGAPFKAYCNERGCTLAGDKQ